MGRITVARLNLIMRRSTKYVHIYMAYGISVFIISLMVFYVTPVGMFHSPMLKNFSLAIYKGGRYFANRKPERPKTIRRLVEGIPMYGL